MNGQCHVVRPDNLVSGHVELVGYRPVYSQFQHLGMICRDRIAAGRAVGIKRSDQGAIGGNHRIAGGSGRPAVGPRYRKSVGAGFERLHIVQRVGRSHRTGNNKQAQGSQSINPAIHNNSIRGLSFQSLPKQFPWHQTYISDNWLEAHQIQNIGFKVNAGSNFY